jgi:hypothetical protein
LPRFNDTHKQKRETATKRLQEENIFLGREAEKRLKKEIRS